MRFTKTLRTGAGWLCPGAHAGSRPHGIVFTIGKSKRRHPRHGKVVETAKRIIVEWSPELRAVVDQLKKLGPQIRPTLLCTLEGKPFTSDGFRSNWHRLMTKATTPGDKSEPAALTERFKRPSSQVGERR
jgi:hypothetical protein